jgi:hypothetical protein
MLGSRGKAGAPMSKFFRCLVALAAPCLAQNPLIRESIGQPEQDAKTLDSYYTAPKVELQSWVGKTFIFLPRDRDGRVKPYEDVVPSALYESAVTSWDNCKQVQAVADQIKARYTAA